jgi:hypothetical protein
MRLPRAPWWMYLLAAAFLTFFATTVYLDLRGPVPPGMGLRFENGKQL